MKRFTCLLAPLLSAFVSNPGQAQDTQIISVSAPGPRSLSYLPIDLISKIGADKDEGLTLRIMHTGGGAVALTNMASGNVDFAVAGAPAALSLRAGGGDVVMIAPVDDAPLFVLMVRAQLADKVTRIADLKGKVVGVNTSTRATKTTSQQLAELLLTSGGVPLDTVRVVPAGQSWDEQSSLMITGTADAVMGDEPFASRLLAAHHVVFLANLAEPDTVKDIPGTGFLHAALATRRDVINSDPEIVSKMVRMLTKTLGWIASHTPEQVVAALEVNDTEERDALLLSLRKYPRAYSHDGKFSTRQLRETDIFFGASSKNYPRARDLGVESIVDDRWAGRKP